jgi:nucleotide-binding universal stress UspA family protein
MQGTDVVVGVDGSPPSRAALRWAAVEAFRRNRRLRIVHACAEDPDDVLADAVAEARTILPDVAGRAVPGDAAGVLLGEARDAELLVVGSRGRGGLASFLLGSVSQQVATHASGPVVVVRGRADTASGRVVVGLDGSKSADVAAHLAFTQATARGCHLLVLRAYSAPLPPRGGGVRPVGYDPDKVRDDLEREFTAVVAGWRAAYPTVPVEAELVAGTASKALIAASRRAQVVVVGSRGHGGFTGLLLGSVGLHLLHQADCPVLVARSG